MDHNIVEALAAISREKNVDRAILMESLVIGLQSAAKKKVGLNADIQVEVDDDSGDIEIIQRKRVVEKVVDSESEISLTQAQATHGAETEVGDVVKTYLDINEFGRNAISVAKQVLTQKVRDAERGKVFQEFRDKIGDVVVGTVQQVDRGNILVSLGRVEALLPFRERIRGENYHQGRSIKAFIIEVQNNSKGPQVILSRTHPGFLKSLFESEVPEIEEGIVEIKAVAREPGTRSKIAVLSNDDRVDAVGSCVGMKGSRVQAVTRELGGEKIDIVPYSPDAVSMIARALSPARVNQIIQDEESKSVMAIVDDDQLSLAIGREGKNVRLAAKLTGWKIDLVSSTEHHLRQRLKEELQIDIRSMTGIDAATAELLENVGITTVEDLSRTSLSLLESIQGVDAEEAATLLATAQATMEELQKQVEEMIAREKSERERPISEAELFGAGPAGAASAEAAAGQLFEGANQEPERKLTEEELFGESKE